ncbi:hypothetical protein HPB50_016368 [Hyalomma asiaticum]|uniref:Uncharacterized protein n=1 Tax=Hyalomma asiaticum TaxID=266040 RepID=A0ACB7SP14_HYAAI|nr:hypothetical protein HPB50_016368 [Hyalomma asiaticum]
MLTVKLGAPDLKEPCVTYGRLRWPILLPRKLRLGRRLLIDALVDRVRDDAFKTAHVGASTTAGGRDDARGDRTSSARPLTTTPISAATLTVPSKRVHSSIRTVVRGSSPSESRL